MESRKEGWCPQVRQTRPYPVLRVSPSWGGAFLHRALPPGLTRVRTRLDREAGALPPPRRLRASAWPLLQRLPELHNEVAVTLGRGPRVPPCSTTGGSRGSRCPQGRRGLREHSPIWACFSFPLRWRPGSPRSACCSDPHRVPRCRLPLPTPLPRAAPSFSGPVTCAL